MAWVFICVAVGAAGFLVYIVVDYLRFAAGMRPKTDQARAVIRSSEAKINAEQNAVKSIKNQVASLQKEVEGREVEVAALQKRLDEFRERERRARPTKHKVDD